MGENGLNLKQELLQAYLEKKITNCIYVVPIFKNQKLITEQQHFNQQWKSYHTPKYYLNLMYSFTYSLIIMRKNIHI